MNKKIYLSENKLNILIETAILEESIFEASSLDEIKETLKRMIAKGIIISATLIVSIISFYHLNNKQAEELKAITKTEISNDNSKQIGWKLAANDVIATVYNAIPSQCNSDFCRTASMFRLNLNDVYSHKIIAMERTFMKELGLVYGDVVKIEGTGKYDGEYQIQDTMNKRFANMHKIDILVPNDIKYGQWDNVKLYVLNDKNLTQKIKQNMASQISKAESEKQMKKSKIRRQ